MCERCNESAITALEALANGEEIPEQPESQVVSVPLMTAQFGEDGYAFVTNGEGYDLISRILRATGLMVPMTEDQG